MRHVIAAPVIAIAGQLRRIEIAQSRRERFELITPRNFELREGRDGIPEPIRGARWSDRPAHPVARHGRLSLARDLSPRRGEIKRPAADHPLLAVEHETRVDLHLGFGDLKLGPHEYATNRPTSLAKFSPYPPE